jgi:hypothetical protein
VHSVFLRQPKSTSSSGGPMLWFGRAAPKSSRQVGRRGKLDPTFAPDPNQLEWRRQPSRDVVVHGTINSGTQALRLSTDHFIRCRESASIRKLAKRQRRTVMLRVGLLLPYGALFHERPSCEDANELLGGQCSCRSPLLGLVYVLRFERTVHDSAHLP